MIINGKEYKVKEISFNTMCELEDNGVSITDMDKKPFSVIRGFLAVIMGVDNNTAGKELNEHIKNGGSIEELATEISKLVENSGFFQAMNR